jgi:hypothetical protein
MNQLQLFLPCAMASRLPRRRGAPLTALSGDDASRGGVQLR